MYKGEYRDGKFHGRGFYREGNGNEYRGEFKEGMFEGHGEYHYATGEVYIGEMRANLMEGYGEYDFANRDVSKATCWTTTRAYGGIFISDVFFLFIHGMVPIGGILRS